MDFAVHKLAVVVEGNQEGIQHKGAAVLGIPHKDAVVVGTQIGDIPLLSEGILEEDKLAAVENCCTLDLPAPTPMENLEHSLKG
jgi:hypothetical protein